MTSGFPRGGISYQQMAEYFAREIAPIEDHMSKHDDWHLERLTAEAQAQRANRIATYAIVITAVGFVVEIVLNLTLHH